LDKKNLLLTNNNIQTKQRLLNSAKFNTFYFSLKKHQNQ